MDIFLIQDMTLTECHSKASSHRASEKVLGSLTIPGDYFLFVSPLIMALHIVAVAAASSRCFRAYSDFHSSLTLLLFLWLVLTSLSFKLSSFHFETNKT